MDPEKLKVVELRTELSQRGLDTKGVKSVLVERLRKAIEEENANHSSEGKVNTSEENVQDDAVQESDEKTTRSAKVPQTPKKSSRLSKSTPVTQREDPAIKKRKTPRMSYSRRRTSPKKSDQNDMSREPSPVPSDFALQEENIPEETAAQEEEVMQVEAAIDEDVKQEEKSDTVEKTDVQEHVEVKEVSEVEEVPAPKEETVKKEIVQQKEKSVSPERNKEPGKKSLPDIQEESSNSKKMMEEAEAKNIEIPEIMESKSSPNICHLSAAKSPVKSPKKSEIILEEVKAGKDNDDQSEEHVESEKSKVDDLNMGEDNRENIVGDTSNKLDDTKKESTQGKEENIESLDSTSTIDTADETKYDSVQDVEEQADNLLEEEDIDINDNDNLKMEDEIMESMDNRKEVESIADNEHDQEVHDVEMPEIKHNEDSDIRMKEEVTSKVVRDKKRKRSPSPLEYRHESPPPLIVENEPDIDDSALILSWYDSDLNLEIDKDGFFTATPMHNDGFSHMWAGARASYGFLCGKVYYEAKIVDYCTVKSEKEHQAHVLRIGWSAPYTSMQLGEEKLSFGYCSTGRKLTDKKYEDYGVEFGKNDVIGCYCDASSENVILSYTVNGKDQGVAFSISKEELGDKALFPHILSKNCSFACNFGQETPWMEEILQDYVSIGNVESQYKTPGARRPEKKGDCEVIMMCGLPACGKTTWATKQTTEHPQKMYNILGLGSLLSKMKDPGESNQEQYDEQWKLLIEKCTIALDKLMEIASSRRRNYILDQTNIYPGAQRRKMKSFNGYQRKAVVVVPSEDEYKSRTVKHNSNVESKEITRSTLLEMKASFRPPVVGESFDVVDWVELNREQGEEMIAKYNKEGKDAGYGEQVSKRARIDSKSGSTSESRNDGRSSRDSRDSRDYRDRRNNYPDRNRNPIRRGGGGGGGGGGGSSSNMGWRDRSQRGGGGGPIRHTGGYGPPPMPRRRRGAPIPLIHRGMNRRGGNGDRRGGNDRGRIISSRQGPRPRAPIGNYQGSQQFAWNQQSNWSTQPQDGWGHQSNWGSSQPWESWKSYGQGSYSQGNYNPQGYGNGNWNSWNHQYYNQYLGQQQSSGQNTTSSGQTTSKQ